MRDVAELFARLQLRPDATEKDVRRAYARELKQIDQEQQAQAFQELRETYDRLILWIHHRRTQEQKQAQVTEETSVATDAVSSGHPAEPQRHDSAEPIAQAVPAPVQALSPEALGREVLDLLIQQLGAEKQLGRQFMADFLRQCLGDPRLSSVDASNYFEWGVASILASGWRGGHDLLFAPAIEYFGWRQDRSRLLWFGQPGHIVDAAINELIAFDAQPPEHRALQKEVIRKLRSSQRPRTGDLIKELPVAEYVVGAFPNWMHVISRPQGLQEWQQWHAAIPGWRKTLARRPRLIRKRQQPAPAQTQRTTSSWGMVFLGILLVSGLGRLVSQPSTPPPLPPSQYALDAPTLPPVERSLRNTLEEQQRANYTLSGKPSSPESQLAAIRERAHPEEPPRISYSEKIKLAVQKNIDFIEASQVNGNPAAEFSVRLSPNGDIQSVVLTKASGQSAWDEAARRALLRTGKLPLDVNGQIPSEMVIAMRPR